MKKIVLYILLMVIGGQGLAQKMETDIFNNLKYESREGDYQAYLKKNIFDDLIFSDNKDNVITLKNEYLKLEYRHLPEDADAKFDLFRRLIFDYRNEANYTATYSVDIFGKIIIEDNRRRKVEIGKDIFGNETYDEINGDQKISIKRNLFGGLEYKVNKDEASLQKDIFNNWIYKDSQGNECKFSSETWNKLQKRYGTEEKIFYFLIDEFLNA